MLTMWCAEKLGDLPRQIGINECIIGTGIQPPNTEGGKVVLCMGYKILDQLISAGIVPKNRTIGGSRNKPFYAKFWGHEVTLFITYSPSIRHKDHAAYIDMLCDMKFTQRYAETGKMHPERGNYKYVNDFSEAIANIKAKLEESKFVDITIDLETLGLDPYWKGGAKQVGKTKQTADVPEAYIVTIQLTYEEGQADVVYFNNKRHSTSWYQNFGEQLQWLLNDPRVVLSGANLKYDLHWLWVHFGLECSNFRFDTTLVGNIFDENRSNGLEVHTKIYAPDMGGYSDVFDGSVDKSRMDLVDKEELLYYGGGDTDATLRVKKAMKDELLKPEHKKLCRFYINVLHPSSRAFEKVERTGVHVDMDRFNELDTDLRVEMGNSIEEAKRVLGGRILAKHLDGTKEFGINLTKPSLIMDYMFSPMGLNLKPEKYTATNKVSTALDHILMFKDHPEAGHFIKALERYQSASKTLSTYIVGFRKHLRSDGRLHPTYWFFSGDKARGDGGTVTGRLSARDPAFQTIPKHTDWGKRIRKCYTAPDGYLVGEFDYSQGELKVVACVAEEENMIRAYAEGKDLHVLTAAGMLGLTYEQMMELKVSDPDTFGVYRQYGKPCNFGLLYGMSAGGLRTYAYESYGVSFTEKQSEQFRTAFFESYPMLPVYHNAYKNMAKRDGYVESPLGRRRNLPLIRSPLSDIRAGAERQAINSPIQATLSDMLCWAVAIGNETGFLDYCPSFGAIHDATYNYIPEDRVDECVQRQLEILENLPFAKVGWNPQLKFTADAKVGLSMGELDDYKAA